MEKNHKIDELASVHYIMSSDEDQPLVEDLAAGIDALANFVVAIDHSDYDDPRYNCSTWLVVREDEARRLAKRFGVSYLKLPAYIGQAMEGWNGIINPTLNQVRDCFQEISEWLIDEGCHFRIKRYYGYGGYLCC